MRTLVCRTDPRKPSAKAVDAAADAIMNGRLVVFPTETVYGIGANAFDEDACRKIYEVKGRASDNPLIVHVQNVDDALKLGRISKEHVAVLEHIWPGPLTVIVKSRGILPGTVTAGLRSVAIRCPEGKFIQELLKRTGLPIAAPSANISAKPSSTKGEHAIGYFKGKVDVIIDGGESYYGIESTIFDLRSLRILRPGAFTPEQIEKAFGKRPILGKLAEGTASAGHVISPGTKYKHYSPETPLFVYAGDMKDMRSMLETFGSKAAFIGSTESCSLLKGTGLRLLSLGPSDNAQERVHRLFDKLIELDSFGVDFGVIEAFPAKGLGYAAMNRLRKASSHRSFSNIKQLQELLEQV